MLLLSTWNRYSIAMLMAFPTNKKIAKSKIKTLDQCVKFVPSQCKRHKNDAMVTSLKSKVQSLCMIFFVCMFLKIPY